MQNNQTGETKLKKNILDRLAADSRPATIGKRKKIRSTTIIAWLFIAPNLLALTLCVWKPVVTAFVYSLFKMRGYTPTEFVGFANYAKVIGDTHFVLSIVNTLKYVFWELLLGFIPPVIVAVLLNEVKRGHKTFKFMIYFPVIVPGIVSALMWKVFYEPDVNGLINNILLKLGMEAQPFLNSPKGVIFWICISSAWNSLGGNLIYYLASLQGINSELYEAAAIEGAGIFQRARHITIPQISGVVYLFLVRKIIAVFQTMERPLAMTDGGPNFASMPIGLQMYRYAFENFKTEYAMALGVVQFLMLICITIFYFYLQKRVTTE